MAVVVVIDDDPETLRYMRECLLRNGHRILSTDYDFIVFETAGTGDGDGASAASRDDLIVHVKNHHLAPPPAVMVACSDRWGACPSRGSRLQPQARRVRRRSSWRPGRRAAS